jgi:hypothetical protein
MSKSKKEKGTINSTQDSVKNHLQDNKTKQYNIGSNKLFKVKSIIPKTTFVIKLLNYQFKIDLIKS